MIKRSFDIAASAIGLLVLSPILVVVALLVRLTMGSPVLFSQDRPLISLGQDDDLGP